MTEGILSIIGLGLIVAAIAGGAVKLAGNELPAVQTVPRQILLGALGATLVAIGQWSVIEPHWRAFANAPAALVPPAPPPVADRPAQPATASLCLSGFVWREARTGDTVCVTLEARELAWRENAMAAERHEAQRRGDGLLYCLPGFVWREAFLGDWTCVPPAARDRVAQENALSATRMASP